MPRQPISSLQRATSMICARYSSFGTSLDCGQVEYRSTAPLLVTPIKNSCWGLASVDLAASARDDESSVLRGSSRASGRERRAGRLAGARVETDGRHARVLDVPACSREPPVGFLDFVDAQSHDRRGVVGRNALLVGEQQKVARVGGETGGEVRRPVALGRLARLSLHDLRGNVEAAGELL